MAEGRLRCGAREAGAVAPPAAAGGLDGDTWPLWRYERWLGLGRRQDADAEHGVEHGEQLAHAGDERDLAGLPAARRRR